MTEWHFFFLNGNGDYSLKALKGNMSITLVQSAFLLSAGLSVYQWEKNKNKKAYRSWGLSSDLFKIFYFGKKASLFERFSNRMQSNLRAVNHYHGHFRLLWWSLSEPTSVWRSHHPLSFIFLSLHFPLELNLPLVSVRSSPRLHISLFPVECLCVCHCALTGLCTVPLLSSLFYY